MFEKVWSIFMAMCGSVIGLVVLIKHPEYTPARSIFVVVIWCLIFATVANLLRMIISYILKKYKNK